MEQAQPASFSESTNIAIQNARQKDEKKEARCRAAKNLNCTVELENFAMKYKNLVCGAKTAGCMYESQDGMIAAFLGKGLSELQIRSCWWAQSSAYTQ